MVIRYCITDNTDTKVSVLYILQDIILKEDSKYGKQQNPGDRDYRKEEG